MLRPPETFATARLTARPPTVADAPEVFRAYASDPEVTRYLTWKAYVKLPPLEEFLKGREETWRTGAGHFAWLLRLRDNQEVVGSIGLSIERHHVVFGYVLGRKHWGRGLMAEPLRWLVDWSLAQPGIVRAWAFCDVENPSSARVMEKAGMQREGILRRWHVCPSIGPEPRDCIVCARVR
ncbi:MAG: GNAT family N-acetyltransferase [Verrucomicrobia bacterium]|nr:GNAT family N-acetyltransferase [Verrucomicrobiota bacterium]